MTQKDDGCISLFGCVTQRMQLGFFYFCLILKQATTETESGELLNGSFPILPTNFYLNSRFSLAISILSSRVFVAWFFAFAMRGAAVTNGSKTLATLLAIPIRVNSTLSSPFTRNPRVFDFESHITSSTLLLSASDNSWHGVDESVQFMFLQISSINSPELDLHPWR